jgi:hypothetical protein
MTNAERKLAGPMFPEQAQDHPISRFPDVSRAFQSFSTSGRSIARELGYTLLNATWRTTTGLTFFSFSE